LKRVLYFSTQEMSPFNLIVSFLFLLVSSVSGDLGSMSRSEPEATGLAAPPVEDLASLLFQKAIQKDEIFSHAITILDSLKSAPSCHRLATASLVDSCSSLERSRDGETSLAEEREKYAARLAMCELMGAKIVVPHQCSYFVPETVGCPKQMHAMGFNMWRRGSGENKKPCFREVSTVQMENCLAALNERPQWWTSYSNALQNVLIVCQASRNSVEKGTTWALNHP
jgi:hypothetical protein